MEIESLVAQAFISAMGPGGRGSRTQGHPQILCQIEDIIDYMSVTLLPKTNKTTTNEKEERKNN